MWGDVGMGDIPATYSVKQLEPKDPNIEKPEEKKSNPCKMQDQACLSHLPCYTEKRAHVASC